jgi:hypothetical protein
MANSPVSAAARLVGIANSVDAPRLPTPTHLIFALPRDNPNTRHIICAKDVQIGATLALLVARCLRAPINNGNAEGEASDARPLDGAEQEASYNPRILES